MALRDFLLVSISWAGAHGDARVAPRPRLKPTKSAWTEIGIVHRPWTKIGIVYRSEKEPAEALEHAGFRELGFCGPDREDPSQGAGNGAGTDPVSARNLYTIPISGQHLYTIPISVHDLFGLFALPGAAANGPGFDRS